MIEPLFAQGAGVRTLSRVRVDVILQIALLMKAFAANRAFVRLVVLMGFHVGYEGGGSVKSFITDFAFEGSIRRMYGFVTA